MENKPRKLVLSQETLRNLSRNELESVKGGFNTATGCPSGGPVPSCPECNPPDTYTCP